MYTDPRKKPQNRKFHGPSTWQPYKKVDGKVVENEKFIKYYGPKKFKEFNPDPDKQKFYEKKYGRPSVR